MVIAVDIFDMGRREEGVGGVGMRWSGALHKSRSIDF